MIYSRNILLFFFSLALYTNVFAQNEELLELISVDACECITNIPASVTPNEFTPKFEDCLTKYFQENAELLEDFAISVNADFDMSSLGEEFGIKLGEKLVQSCPAFLERMVASNKLIGQVYYAKLLEGNKRIQTEGCVSANILYSEIIEEAKDVPDSTLATAFNNRGYCKFQLGDYYGSVSDLNEAINMIPNFALAYNHRANSKRALGDYKNSIIDYDKALEINENYQAALNGRGLSNYYLGNVEVAFNDYNRALEIDSTFGAVYFNLGLLYNYIEDYESAVINFKKVYTLSPEIADLSYYTSLAYGGLELYDEAIAVLTNDSLTVNDEYNLTEIGKYHYYLGNFEEAIEYQTKSIALNSNWYYSYLFRAYTYQDSGLYEQALPDFDKAFSLDSSFSEIPFYYGYSYFKLGDYENAIKQFTKAIFISANYAEAFDYRARSKVELEDYLGAIEDFTASIKEYPDDDQIYKERGDVYLKLDDKENACTDFLLAKQFGNTEVSELITESCKE